MLVGYDKKQKQVRDFEFIKKVELTSQNGRTYHRMFWKLKAADKIATYIELSLKFNRDEISQIQDEVDDRIVGFSFGKKTRDKEEPKYIIQFEDGGTKKLSYSELKKKVKDSETATKMILESPFVLGENMYRQANQLTGKKHRSTSRIF